MKTQSKRFLFLILSSFLITSCGESANEVEQEKPLAPLVKIEPATLKSFKHEIRIQGNIETDKDILLSAEMGGLITSIKAKEGQIVTKGQVIATVDASVLASNMEELKTQLEYAEYMLKKQEALFERGVGSEFDLESAKSRVNSLKSSMQSLSTQTGKSVIKAPFTGVIDEVFAKQGQMAGPSSPIVRLVNNKTVDVVATISEKHLAKIKVGTPITVSFPNYSDTSIQLKITNVGNFINPTNRTFRIKSTITNNTFFLPNMLAEVSVTDMNVDNGLVIPSVAIMKDQENNDFVYKAISFNDPNSKETELFKVKKVIVTVIERFEGEALITSKGISNNTPVVVKGARGVANNDIVRIK